MSILWKIAQGFGALGGIGVGSLFFVKPSEPLRYFDAPPAETSETIDQLIEAGYKDCSQLTGRRGLGTFYVCWYLKTDGSTEPSFFYYSKSRKTGVLKSSFKRITQIETKKLTYSDGSSESLIHDPFWMGKWKGVLMPERYCTTPTKIVKSGNSVNKLTCTNPQDRQEVHIY